MKNITHEFRCTVVCITQNTKIAKCAVAIDVLNELLYEKPKTKRHCRMCTELKLFQDLNQNNMFGSYTTTDD